MNLRILSLAQDDLLHAAQWYEGRQTGLGARFLQAYEASLRWILDSSTAGAPMEMIETQRDIHRARLKRFPYIIVFERFQDGICILAVAHMSRRPSHWISRQP